MGSIRYRPEIDGLRAIAVIPVVLFHMGSQRLAGGFLGVDVFFVISGYLITSIILKDYDGDAFRFSTFWLRRVRRIFPALVVMLTVTSIASYFLVFRGELNDLGRHGISAILSIANIAMWRTPGGYWGADAENSVFLHTWSLSVEEQFYFVYPFLMALLMKVARKWILPIMSGIAVCSFVLYLYGSQHHSSATFFLLPTRAWELATGCLVATVLWKRNLEVSRRTSSIMALIGCAAVILSYLCVSAEHRFLGYLALPVFGSALIILFAREHDGSMVRRILSLAPLVAIGKISYSLYLWHWPILVMAKQKWPVDRGIVPVSLVLVAITLMSLASFYLVEQPARHRKNILGFAAFAFVCSLSLSIFLYRSHLSYDCSKYSKLQWNGQLYNVNPTDTWPESIRKRMEGVDVPRRQASQADAYATGGIIKQYGGPTPEVVVLGDSHALMWSGVIDIICKQMNVTVSFYGADATSAFIRLPLTKPLTDDLFWTTEQKCLFDCKRLAFIKEWKPKIVVLGASWSGVGSMAVAEDLVRYIGELGSSIILIEQPPMLFFGDRNALQYVAFMGVAPKDNERQYIPTARSLEYEAGRNLIRQISGEYPYCTIVPVADLFHQEGAGAWVLDGPRVLYIDDDHLSQTAPYS